MSGISSILGPRGEALPSAPRRALAAMVAQSRTAYEAADYGGQELAAFLPVSGSADRDLLFEQRTIVDRVRDLVRNNGWASGAVSREIDAVIGANFRPEPRPDWRALGISAETAADLADQMETEWSLFANDSHRYCDATRQDTWSGLAGLLYRHSVVDGEHLALVLWRPRGGRYSTCLRVIDPDRLGNPNGAPDDDHLRGGVQLDGDGAAIGYWICSGHPRDVGLSAWAGQDWDYVARETEWGRPLVIHGYDRQRAEQHRGLSDFAPVLKAAKMLDRYQSAELAAALLNATLAAFIESPFDHEFLMDLLQDGGGQQAFDKYQGLRVADHDRRHPTLGGLSIPALFPGEKVEFFNPVRPAAQAEAFTGAMLRNIAAALPAHTAETVTLNYSDVNYSSARAGALVSARSVIRKRIAFGARTAMQVYGAVMEEAFLTGKLTPPAGAPDFDLAREAYLAADWIGPAQGWIDPVKEAQAAAIRMNNRLSTLREECGDQGADWRDTMDQLARERAYARKLGLPDPNLKADLAIRAPTDDARPSHDDVAHDDVASSRIARFEAWAARAAEQRQLQ